MYKGIADLQLSEALGYETGKAFIIKAAEIWCSKPVESAAFSPEQNIKQGQIKTANELLEYLKR